MSPDELLARLLIAIAIVIAVGRILGIGLQRLGQPPVMAEIIAGIALGPTLLGALPGDPSAALFTEPVREALAAIGGLGVLLFMFLVGLDFDLKIARRTRTILSISTGSLVVPFALGIPLAAVLHGDHGVVDGQDVPFLPFALFVATALSITAFPVLARILADRGWQNTPLGTLALGCAGVQDAAGWILLTVALVASQANSALPLARIVVETAAFAAVLLIVVRPLLQAMCRRPRPSGAVTADVLAVVAVGLIACAAATQAIGLHSVLGAFCFGLAFPREEAPELVAALKRALRPVTVSVLLPIFFVTPGLSVDLTALDVAGAGELALIFAVACTGKLLGAGIGARAAGLRGREVGQLAALMNTRGLMELIVLNVGLTAGLLDIRLFSEFVVMAVATTLMTGPLLRLANKHYSTRPGAGRRTSRATSATSASEITVTARNLPP